MARSKHPLSIVVSAVDQVTGPMRRIEKVIEKTLDPVKKLRAKLRLEYQRSGIPKFLTGFRTMAAGVGRAARAVGGLIVRLGAMGAAGATAAIALLKHFAQASEEVLILSRNLGVSTRSVQAWRFAARQAGIETDTFDEALKAFNVRLFDAARGNEEVAEAFRAIGVEVKDANGQVRGTEELFRDVADGISRVEDAGARFALADLLFEGEGAALVGMLRDGSAGLDEMARKAEKSGAVLGGGALKAAQSFNASIRDLMESLRGMASQIAVAVMPAVTGFFQELVGNIQASRERILSWVQGFMQGLPARLSMLRERLRGLWESLEPLLQRLRAFGSWLAQNDRWVAALALGAASLAAVLAGPLILGLALVTKGVAALGVALLATPVGWIIGGLTAVAGVVYLLSTRWDWLKERVGIAVDWITAKVGWLRDKTVGVLEDIGGWVAGLFGDGGEVDQAARRTAGLRDELAGASAAAVAGGSGLAGVDPRSLLGPAAPAAAPPAQAEVAVRFENAPPNVRVDADRRGDADVRLEVGYSMEGIAQ
ncbi:MAG: phage tail tape measure protein [Planctomycetota bacterium]